MNLNWKNYLLSLDARFGDQGDIVFPQDSSKAGNTLHPIRHLGVIKITGGDAEKFLQGQLTCNVREISASKANFAAYCSAKGRVISTLILIRKGDDFLMILPDDLLASVKKKLQMFVMRADVQLTDCRDTLCLFGYNCTMPGTVSFTLPDRPFFALDDLSVTWLKLPGSTSRFLAICSPDEAIACWQSLLDNQQAQAADSHAWDYQDMQSGMAWLSERTTEQYIPQMLNLDQLNGISFNKGCYVGQEIVARTHYLGKTKRLMYLGEYSGNPCSPEDEIYMDNETEPQSAGKVLSCLESDGSVMLQVILPSSIAENKNIRLQTPDGDTITLSELKYSL